MTSDELNKLLKKHDLGDDWLEDKNRLFDTEFPLFKRLSFLTAMAHANKMMEWYWSDPQKYYLLADCNRFHFMWLGHFQEWCTKNGIVNPPIGRAYGYWEGQNHNWAWLSVEDELVFVNWGHEIKPSEVNYDGKGSVAV